MKLLRKWIEGILMNLRVYTIGHSNFEADKFIKLLKQFDIQVLIDVRSKPYSRYAPHFNKESIKHLCKENGIKYLFLGNSLGGMPEDNTAICKSTKKVDYGLLVEKDYFLSGVDMLLDQIKKHRVCLMCSEGQPDKCHRHLLLAPVLEKREIEVLHILPDGNLINSKNLRLKISKGQLTLF
jgi:uncharacterized protein (DUF488 family)